MKKFLTHLLLIGLIACAPLILLDGYFTRVFKTGKTNKTQWLSRVSNTAYDVGVLGSSRAWWNIDMNVIQDSLAIRAINLSDNHYTFHEMLLRMKQFYANGNSVDRLFIEVDYWILLQSPQPASITAYNNIPFLDDSLTYQHLRARSNEWVKLKYIPFWRYAEFNRQWGLEELLITAFGVRNSIFDQTGTFFSNNRFYGTNSFVPPLSESEEISPDFVTLIDFCRTHEIDIQIFTAPIYRANMVGQDQQKMERYLSGNKLAYLNYADVFQDSTYFNDNLHFSIKGGAAFTELLIQEMKPDTLDLAISRQ